ncbi:RNA polymerase recycling motor HelD [Bacillus cihuensis]|uniref:RNA polymerase recycling motor HelD n=1 Tax=Bacillus cihuensis TaxID=1208599 RepID=UPI0004140443|nr:RNA polymerase recycling motor HelD [Bacillus cihuensis]
MTNWENERECEQKRIEVVIDKVTKMEHQLKQSAGEATSDIVSIRKRFWEDVSVNVENEDETIETVASINQQTELLSERERRQKHSMKQIAVLNRLQTSPYFARIDFHEKDMKEREQIYIGIGTFYDEEREEFLIFDWRAPISSVYYDFAPGPATYTAPSEKVSGELLLKRQFIIRNGVLEGMFDTGEAIRDDLLQEVLGKQANTQMKSIVATIQREQNIIIRNEKSRLLLVQGAAGSGKTSAAMQRIAYLLYRYREGMSAENILLFSPNPLFNSYVANVLPELGEDNMQQTTFQQYLLAMLGEKFEIEDVFDQLEFVLNNKGSLKYTTRMNSIQYKSSLNYLQGMNEYLETLKSEGLVFKHIKVRGKLLVSAMEISKYFYELGSEKSIPNRLQIVSGWLLKKIKKFEKLERKEAWVEEEIQYLEKEDYLRSYRIANKQQDERDSFDEVEQEQRILSEYVVKKRFKPLYRKIKSLDFLDVRSIYKKMLETEWPVTDWKEIRSLTIHELSNGRLLYEDATPFLYMKKQLEGFATNSQIRFLFIDEAQDYSPFQFAFLKNLFPKSKLTILGDFNQTIYAHGNNEGLDILTYLFEKNETEKVILNRSYRSTKEIVEFTKSLLLDGSQIEPFNRQGKKPVLVYCENQEHHTSEVLKKTKEFIESGHKTIAIICKTQAETILAYEELKGKMELKRIGVGKTTFTDGVMIIPSYLAKGIEFDAVIIYNASEDQYGLESERKLLYTSCTRAMHELCICFTGEMSPFIPH